MPVFIFVDKSLIEFLLLFLIFSAASILTIHPLFLTRLLQAINQ